MGKKEQTKRYILLVAGLFFSALGVAITKRGELGVSPTSSVANVMSIRFPALTLGTWLVIWNILLILGQVAVLGKKFRPVQLLQIPLSFLFGYFTDFGSWLVSFVPAGAYPARLALVVIGTVVRSLGILLTLVADKIMNSGEAFVKAVADVSGKRFGNVKIAFDVVCVALSVALSLALCGFRILGTREGTLIAAVFTGFTVDLWSRWLKAPLERYVRK